MISVEKPTQADTDLVEQMRRLYRGLEMSGRIMRDVERTGGWRGADRTAAAFERYAATAQSIHALLKASAAAREATPEPRLAADQAARTTTTEGEQHCAYGHAAAFAGCDDCPYIHGPHATPPATPAGGGERERIARIIVGPRNPVPATSPQTLEQLQEIRWGMLSKQEQGYSLLIADAILAALSPSPDDAPAREAGE